MSFKDVLGLAEAAPVVAERKFSIPDRFGLTHVAVPESAVISDGPVTRYGRPVGESRDLRRVLELPRRPVPDKVAAQALVEHWTAKLKRPEGTQTLRGVQAWALDEIYRAEGLVGGIPVGGGKTLLDLLAAMVLPECRRAVLLIPASLRPQMAHDIAEYGQHWKLPNIADGDTFIPGRPTLHVVAYSKLSHESATDLLAQIGPDLIIADEGHSLRNHTASRTIRFVRYFAKAHGTRFCTWSGSLAEASIKDYAHLSELALGEGSPVPLHWPTVEEWSKALDPQMGAALPNPPGLLRQMCEPGEIVEHGFRRRLLETPGIVSTEQSEVTYVDKDGIERPIRLTMHVRDPGPMPEAVAKALGDVRREWRRPDGEEFVEYVERARCAVQVAAGFFYRWRYPHGEPEDLIVRWFLARQAWHAELREKLKRPKAFLDSPLWATRAAIRYYDGKPPLPARPTWAAQSWPEWRDVHDKVKPETEAVWLDDYLARDAALWAKTHNGIVWCSHTTFAQRVAKLAGIEYFGQGEDAAEAIQHEKGDRSIVASIDAHGTGKNLQMFSKQLVANPPASGSKWEQLLGRLHRPKQKAPVVETWVYQHTTELRERLEKAIERATYQENTWGSKKKLLIAEFDNSFSGK